MDQGAKVPDSLQPVQRARPDRPAGDVARDAFGLVDPGAQVDRDDHVGERRESTQLAAHAAPGAGDQASRHHAGHANDSTRESQPPT